MRPNRDVGFVVVLSALLVVLLALAGGCGEDDQQQRGDLFDPEPYGLYEYTRGPRLEGPNLVDFGQMRRNELRVREVLFRNRGPVDLSISGWEISPEFELAFPETGYPPKVIEAGAEVAVELSHRSGGFDSRGKLRIYSDDPRQPHWSTTLLAASQGPCLAIEPNSAELDFGNHAINKQVIETVVLRNCSTRESTSFVLKAFEGNEVFKLMGGVDVGDVVDLAPGETREVAIHFRASSAGMFEGALVLGSDEDEDRVITLKALIDTSCPVAVLRASHPERGEVRSQGQEVALALEPLDRVEFVDDGSFDPQGLELVNSTITLISKPRDSSLRLSPDEATGDALEAYLDLAGDYVVELHVVNTRGVRSCRPARIRLSAVPSQALHMQLVWRTPSDPNPDNDIGADLDLHFLHPRGEWNIAPWDVNWNNPKPDWGRPGDDRDNPSLDLDDRNGQGPENINLRAPEANTAYKIGAHYFSDAAFGFSRATVRVYINGTLAGEAGTSMEGRQFWHAFTLSNWPNYKLDRIDTELGLVDEMPNAL